MGRQAIDGLIAIVTAVIALAIIGVILSTKSNTANVLSSAGSAFSGILSAATGSISGGSTNSLGISSTGSSNISLPTGASGNVLF